MLICRSCNRKIDATEVKYRVTVDGRSLTICPDCAKKQGV